MFASRKSFLQSLPAWQAFEKIGVSPKTLAIPVWLRLAFIPVPWHRTCGHVRAGGGLLVPSMYVRKGKGCFPIVLNELATRTCCSLVSPLGLYAAAAKTELNCGSLAGVGTH